jgi:RsiW-degrading membrane proteinase PrsW (M82 family)
MLAAVAFMLPVAMYIAGQPELVGKIMSLAETIQEAPPSPDTLLQEFGPYLVRPAVLFGVLVFGAVIVPLIEELIKPIGVWLLAKRRLRPAAGFAAGALSGAGYAFFESLALTSGGQEWPALMLARVGTASVHILTTAITGWALVQAWTHRRYVLLGLCYLTSVAIHGLWNGLTIYSAFTALAEMQNLPIEVPTGTGLAMAAPASLVALGFGSLGLLIFFNRKLAARTATSAVPPDTGTTADAPQKSVL